MDIDVIFKSRFFHFLKADPVAIALIEILSDPMQDTYDVCEFIKDHSSIDTAEGIQLDLIGGMIGIARPPAQETSIFALNGVGEYVDPDNDTGFFDDTDAVETGGYMTSAGGLQAIDGSDMSDTNYRYLIRQQAAAYRKRMTRTNLFNYLLAFGAKCFIDDDDTLSVEIDPLVYYDLDEWEKEYAITQGFKPAGIDVYFKDNVRDGDSI